MLLSLEHWLLVLAYLTAFGTVVSAFDPQTYAKSTARCKAIRRGPNTQETKIDLSELFMLSNFSFLKS